MIRRSRLHTAAAPLAFSANPTVVLTPLRGHLHVVEDNFYLKENSMAYVGEARVAQLTPPRTRELWLWFVALLFCPGCLTHLIVLCFADAFFEHLRTLAPSLGIFIFSEGVCCLPSG